MLTILLATLSSPPAMATGIPPMAEVRVVDKTCQQTADPVDPLRITYDLWTGACAPGGPCSHWVEESLDATELVVVRRGCTEPLKGRFVRDGECDGRPRWRWTGELHAGHAHTIGLDLQPPLGLAQIRGKTTDAPCPTPSPRTDAVTTEITVSPASPPQRTAFPADQFAVVEDPAGAALQWTPGPMQRGWVLSDEHAVFRTEAMERQEAQRLLESAATEPSGLSVHHQIVAYREHFEGWKLRGIPQCERILEMDVEQRVISATTGEPAGPPLRGTASKREAAAVERCFPQ